MSRRRGIQALQHRTVDLGSDHRALGVELRIVNGGNSVIVKGGSFNLGPAKMTAVRALVLALGRRGFLCIQEAGGQTDLIEETVDVYGWRILGRTGAPGAASTIVIVGPEVHTRATLLRRLLRRVFVGPGAGPRISKQKWWNGGRVEVGGVIFGISAVHALASQQKHRRMMWSLRWARLLTAATFDRRVPWIVGGDFNTNLAHDKGLARWLTRNGWTSNHRELGPLPTHGQRAIDALMWRESDNIPAR